MQELSYINIFVIGAVLLGAALISSCDYLSGQDEQLPVDEETYIRLIVEFQLVNGYYNNFSSEADTLAPPDSLRKAILAKHDVSWDEFQQSHDVYKTEAEKQKERIIKAIELLRSEAEQPVMDNQPNQK